MDVIIDAKDIIRKVSKDQESIMVEMDQVVQDKIVQIKKYYLFRTQFDFQLFPSLFFIENNGRDSIARNVQSYAAIKAT